MTIWIDAEAFVEALNRSSVWGWSTEQDETVHKWVFGEIEKFLNDNQQPDSDLISRQDAIDAFRNVLDSDFPYISEVTPRERIESIPSAPNSRQRGEWVRLEREENVYDLHGVPTWGVNYMCDKCGFITTAIQDHFAQYKWCPSCGARMYKGGDPE